MINVQSLKIRIVLQFALIIAPIATVLVLQRAADTQRSKTIEHAFGEHRKSIAARDLFKTFLGGAADAVQSGRLSRRPYEGLREAAGLTRTLPGAFEKSELEPLQVEIDRLVAAVANDSGPSTLLALRDEIAQVRSQLTALEIRYERASSAEIEDALTSSQRQQYYVGAATALTLLLATNWC